MKKITSTLLAGAMLMAAPLAANAGEGTGVIDSIDPVTRTIILQDGTMWVAADGLAIEALQAGDAVAVEFEDGTTNLTAIEKVE